MSITTTAPRDAAADAEPDVILSDVILLDRGDCASAELYRLLRHTSSVVIAVERTLRPALGARAKEKGVEWAITLDITGDELVEVIHAVVLGHLEEAPAARTWDAGTHLGSSAGVSARESQVLELVVQGRSNQEIADALFISINSVKTYIRSAYRKVGVTSRAQAVAWGIQHGFPVELAGRDSLDSPQWAPL